MKVVNLGRIDYDGSQLRHAFVYEQTKQILGPTIAYFRGRADVKQHLVDLEDSLADDFIKSADMWHFIIELPDATLTEAVALQRLFITQCIDNIRTWDMAENMELAAFERDGDDIKVNGRKLSVSIATLSRFSALIHVGINVTVGEGCPVKAIGLSEFLTQGIDSFGWDLATIFAHEYKDIKDATYKVTEV